MKSPVYATFFARSGPLARLTSLSILLAACISCGGDSNNGGNTLGCSLAGAGSKSKGDKIFNGEQCRGDESSIVLLVNKDSRGSAVSSCTGTLISPTAVLAAAHCFEQHDGVAIRSVDVYVGGGIRNSTIFRVHPQYGGEPADPHDVAVVKLPIPVSAIPLPIRGSRAPSEEEVIRVFGYGDDESQQSLFEQDVYEAGPKQTDLDIVYAGDGTIVAGAKDTGVCAGDSGGPVIAGDQPQVLGVISAGLYVEQTPAGNPKCASSILSRQQLREVLNSPSDEELDQLLPLSPDGGKSFAVNFFVDISASETLNFIVREADGVVIE